MMYSLRDGQLTTGICNLVILIHNVRYQHILYFRLFIQQQVKAHKIEGSLILYFRLKENIYMN